MRAFPVIVLEMGTRHGHQVNRPSVQTNQTGQSWNIRLSSSCAHTPQKSMHLSKQTRPWQYEDGNTMFTASLSGRRTLHPHPGLWWCLCLGNKNGISTVQMILRIQSIPFTSRDPRRFILFQGGPRDYGTTLFWLVSSSPVISLTCGIG